MAGGGRPDVGVAPLQGASNPGARPTGTSVAGDGGTAGASAREVVGDLWARGETLGVAVDPLRPEARAGVERLASKSGDQVGMAAVPLVGRHVMRRDEADLAAALGDASKMRDEGMELVRQARRRPLTAAERSRLATISASLKETSGKLHAASDVVGTERGLRDARKARRHARKEAAALAAGAVTALSKADDAESTAKADEAIVTGGAKVVADQALLPARQARRVGKARRRAARAADRAMGAGRGVLAGVVPRRRSLAASALSGVTKSALAAVGGGGEAATGGAAAGLATRSVATRWHASSGTMRGRAAYVTRRVVGTPLKVLRRATAPKALAVLVAVLVALAPTLGCVAVAFMPMMAIPALTQWSGGGAGSLTGVEAQVALALRTYGFSDAAIAGVLGNIHAESSFNPTSSGGGAWGLYQFTPPTKFFEWCAANGKDRASVGDQTEYIVEVTGLNGYSARSGTSYRGLGDGADSATMYATTDEYKIATDPVSAAYSWMAGVERCAADYRAHWGRRKSMALEYYEKLQGDGIYSGELGGAVGYGMSHLGIPYVFGGTPWDETAGTDCSGWVARCYHYGAGIDFGLRPTASWFLHTDRFVTISADEVRPGDIEVSEGHVVLCLGDGRICEEPLPGGVSQVVHDYHFGTYRRYVG